MNIGSGDNGQITFLDCIGVLSFLVGLENLDLNVTQEDAQRLMQSIDEKTASVLSEIHAHLQSQDSKLDAILEAIKNDRRGNF